VRQAQLGASYRVSYQKGVASLYRAKPNQQPVSSVAPVAEPVYAPVNKTGEAYTENTVGHRGSDITRFETLPCVSTGNVLPQGDSAPLMK